MKRAALLATLALAGCGSHAAPQLKEPDAGDEHGISVAVRVTVTKRAVRVTPRTVAAFLPLRFRISGARTIRLRTTPLTDREAVTTGLKPGRYAIRAGHGRHTTLVVKPGG